MKHTQYGTLSDEELLREADRFPDDPLITELAMRLELLMDDFDSLEQDSAANEKGLREELEAQAIFLELMEGQVEAYKAKVVELENELAAQQAA